MCLSLSLTPTAASKLVSQWTSECVSKWDASLLIYTRLTHVGRLLLVGGYNHLYYILGPLWYILGPTSSLAYYNYIMTNLQKGIWSFTVADMINPQWGLIQWIIYQIIIRIHFAVTLFQHFFNLPLSATPTSLVVEIGKEPLVPLQLLSVYLTL